MASPVPLLGADDLPLDLTRPFTRTMARRTGISERRLKRLIRDGYLRRAIQGVYVAAQVPDSIGLRAEVLRLVVPPGCFIADRTAARFHGGRMVRAAADQFAVPQISMFRHRDAGRLRNELAHSGERTVDQRDLMEIDGLVATTPLRTALDLGRLERRTQALECLDQLLGLGQFTHEELLAELPRFKGARGVVQLRELAPYADGRAQSPGESALRLAWLDAGLPRPELQIPVEHEGLVIFWLDMGLPDLVFAAEYDGAEWHSRPEDTAYDDARRDWLARKRAYQIEVFRREHVYGQQANALSRLNAAYLRARQTLGQRLARVA